MLHLRIIRDVPGYVADEARRFAAAVQAVVDVRHAILVDVVPATVVTDQRELAFGLFHFDQSGEPTISLAGDLRPLVRQYGRAAAMEHFRDTFAHELAHYEQWRDGRAVQERGVKVRARNIVAKVMAR